MDKVLNEKQIIPTFSVIEHESHPDPVRTSGGFGIDTNIYEPYYQASMESHPSLNPASNIAHATESPKESSRSKKINHGLRWEECVRSLCRFL